MCVCVCVFNKGISSRIYKELHQLSKRKGDLKKRENSKRLEQILHRKEYPKWPMHMHNAQTL